MQPSHLPQDELPPSIRYDLTPPPLVTPPAVTSPAEGPKLKILKYQLQDPSELDRRRGIAFTPELLAAAGLLVLVVFLWLLLLAGLSTPLAAPVDRTYEQASLRQALVLTSERVDDFIQAHYHAPGTLDEIGPQPWSLITYERVSDDRYRLTAPSSAGPIVFDSMGSRERFAGESTARPRNPRAGARP